MKTSVWSGSTPTIDAFRITTKYEADSVCKKQGYLLSCPRWKWNAHRLSINPRYIVTSCMLCPTGCWLELSHDAVHDANALRVRQFSQRAHWIMGWSLFNWLVLLCDIWIRHPDTHRSLGSRECATRTARKRWRNPKIRSGRYEHSLMIIFIRSCTRKRRLTTL